MLIGIDGNEANVRKRVGVGEYAFQVLKHLKNQKPKTKKLASRDSFGIQKPKISYLLEREAS
jgi:hypothetical protein